jgi:hypothetical protein
MSCIQPSMVKLFKASKNKIKNNKYHTVGTVPKLYRKIVVDWYSYHTYTWPFTFLAWYRQFNKKKFRRLQFYLVSFGLGLWCLMPLSTIFQLYCGNQFYWWRKPDKTTDLSHWQTLSPNVVSSTLHHELGLNSQLLWW